MKALLEEASFSKKRDLQIYFYDKEQNEKHVRWELSKPLTAFKTYKNIDNNAQKFIESFSLATEEGEKWVGDKFLPLACEVALKGKVDAIWVRIDGDYLKEIKFKGKGFESTTKSEDERGHWYEFELAKEE